ncbi:MAG: DUF2163 domain-containing protein [Pseudomonadota bacterium]
MTAYEDALRSGSTRLCRCFRLTRADGVVMGFTDHDDDVDLDGLTCRAGAALTATEAASTLGLSPDEMEAHGAFADDAISEADLSAGLYDGARVEVFDVDWSDPATRQLIGRYTIGEVERGGLSFRAELRGLSAMLDRKEGRVHTSLCDVKRLGDARCGVNLSAWQGEAAVVGADRTELTLSGLDAFPSGFFDRGIIRWSSGDNMGGEADIRASMNTGGRVTLSLWREPLAPVTEGDTLTVFAGCDRTSATCRDRFANLVNFRGFPHMPGEAFLTERGRDGDPDQTGDSRFA